MKDEPPGCKACRSVERLGNQNGNAHLRVWPCTWVRKTPAPSGRRAAKGHGLDVAGLQGGEADAAEAPAPLRGSGTAIWDRATVLSLPGSVKEQMVIALLRHRLASVYFPCLDRSLLPRAVCQVWLLVPFLQVAPAQRPS